MRGLTGKQKAILEFIMEHHRTKGYPPSIREIGKRFGIASTNGVRYHLEVLEREGLLEREGYTSRGIRLARRVPVSASLPVPLVGQVAAGQMTLAIEEAEQEVGLDSALFGLNEQDALFCLRVKGNSMRDAGILEGDLVVVQRKTTPQPGQIVVARLGEEATVKRFEKQGNRIILKPENPEYAPIEITPEMDCVEGFEILGVVVGLIRTGLQHPVR